jgi:hypothetical protein
VFHSEGIDLDLVKGCCKRNRKSSSTWDYGKSSKGRSQSQPGRPSPPNTASIVLYLNSPAPIIGFMRTRSIRMPLFLIFERKMGFQRVPLPKFPAFPPFPASQERKRHSPHASPPRAQAPLLYGLAPTTIPCDQFVLDTQARFRYISPRKSEFLSPHLAICLPRKSEFLSPAVALNLEPETRNL